MKFLMIGLGSIGQRHVRNIRKLYGEEAEIWAYRERKLQRTFSDNLQVLNGVNVEEQYNIHCFEDIDDALTNKPDAVFITTITSKHMEYALKAAETGLDVFIEKPLSDSLQGAEQLREAVKKNKNIIYMGYQNRFHPCIRKLKELINENALGKIVSIDSCYGERLTTMHRYEDYKDTYMANKSMGGGCLLNLQIHDLDYLQWIFGMPKNLYADMIQKDNLSTDVEESAVLQYRANKLGYDVLVTSRSDFYQYPPVHTCIIVGEQGRAEIDFNSAVMKVFKGDAAEKFEYPDFQRNDMFIKELSDFVSCMRDRRTPDASLEEGIKGLEIISAAKEFVEGR